MIYPIPFRSPIFPCFSSNRNYIYDFYTRSFYDLFQRWKKSTSVATTMLLKYHEPTVRSLNESRFLFHTMTVRPYLSTSRRYEAWRQRGVKRSIPPSTVSFPASNLSRQIHGEIHSRPLFFHPRSKSISNEQTIRFEPAAKRPPKVLRVFDNQSQFYRWWYPLRWR